MEDKRIKKTLEKKEEIEGEIKAISIEINTLKKNKKDYEKKEKELNKKENSSKLIDSYRDKIKKVNEDINKKEQQKKKMEEIRKELSNAIRTIKCSKTKIANKVKMIDEFNIDIKDINNEINISESEKIKTLLDLERKNMPQLNKLRKKDKSLEDLKKLYVNDDKKIELIELQIKEVRKELDTLEEKIAIEFQEICKKYDLIKKEKKDVIEKKAIELKKANKSIETFKSTIEKTFMKIEDILEKFNISIKKEAENDVTTKDNKAEFEIEMGKFAKAIEQVNKMNNEDIKIEQINNIQNEGIKVSQEKSEQEVDIVVNEIYLGKIKEILESEKSETKIEQSKVLENKKEDKAEETIRTKTEITSNKIVDIEENATKSEMSDIEEDEIIEEQNECFIPTDIQLVGPMYTQAYEDMIRRNGSIIGFRFDDDVDYENDETNSECVNTLVYDWIEEKTIKKMIIKESNDEGESANRYIEIDGKKYTHNRNLDDKTKEDLDYICKRYLKIPNKMTLKDKIRLKMLKSKIDPAIINAIKYRLKAKYRESKSEVKRNYSSSRTPSEINYMVEKVKRNCKYEYTDLITKYIQFLEEKDSEKLSFYLYYDCSENLSSSQYMEIYPYIYNAEKSGAIVINKQKPIEIIKGFLKSNEITCDLKKTTHSEGDKSFIPKVNIPSPAPVKVYSVNSERMRVKKNNRPNNFNGYRY